MSAIFLRLQFSGPYPLAVLLCLWLVVFVFLASLSLINFLVPFYCSVVYIVYRQSLSARSAMCSEVAFSTLFHSVVCPQQILFITSHCWVDLVVEDFIPIFYNSGCSPEVLFIDC